MGRIITPDQALILPKGPRGFNADGLEIPTAYAGLGGRYRMQVHKAKSGTLSHDTGWFSNLITNTGLVNMATAGIINEWAAGCAVGTGNTTPQNTDTQLANYLTKVGAQGSYNPAGIMSYVPQNGSTPPMWVLTYTFVFPTGAAAGNLTEIGTFSPNNPTGQLALTSRALIVDSNGNPTSITVLSNEILTVTYQILFYLDPTDHAFTFNVNGSPVTGTYRIMNMATPTACYWTLQSSSGSNGYASTYIYVYSGNMGINTGAPTGSSTSFTCYTGNCTMTFVNDIVNSDTCYVDVQNVTFTATQANYAGGINSFSAESRFQRMQFGNLSAPINKIAGQQLTMGFRFAWGRYPAGS